MSQIGRAVTCCLSLCLALNVASFLLAQAPEPAKPVNEHQWLKHFVGNWECRFEAPPAPGKPAIKSGGTLQAQMLGELWVVNELKMDMMGTEMRCFQTIGYNVEKKKYVGTWVDSAMNHMWHYEGSVDSTGKILTLEAEGPSFTTPGKMAMFRDAYELKSADQIVATSSVLGEDGKWTVFMTGSMTRLPSDKSVK